MRDNGQKYNLRKKYWKNFPKLMKEKFIHKLKRALWIAKNKLKKKKKDSHKGKDQILKVMVRRLTSHNKQRWLEDYEWNIEGNE